MGAISGVLCFDGTLDVRALGRHLSAGLRHRSPDGIATWNGTSAALACGYLRATPEYRTDVQPLRLPANRVAVIDGMIDNRAEVIRALDLRKRADTLDDAQLLALCWDAWGESLWTRVRGEYAIAVWDATARSLTLVRDRLGARPICYARTSRFFAFASEAEALLGLPGVARAPNMLRIATLWHGDIETDALETTLYQDVRKVPPASLLRCDARGRSRIRRYWKMEPLPELNLGADREYVEAFQEIFGDAVRAKARAASTPALMLSGGIDSASVLAAMRGFKSDGDAGEVLAISMIAHGDVSAQDRQEAANIRAALGSHRLREELPVPAFDGAVSITDLAEAAFAPAHPTDNSLLLPSMVYLAARRRGANVVLDGVDGDVVAASPMNYIATLMSAGSLRDAWREAEAAAAVHTYLQGSDPRKLYARGALRALIPYRILDLRNRIHNAREARALSRSSLHRDLIANLNLGERIRSRASPDADEKVRRCHVLSEGIPQALEAFAHVASRFGVEARHPWADQRVIDFFRCLPQHQLVRRGWTKYLVRAACEPALTQPVAWHSGKAHFGPVLTRALVANNLPYLRQLLSGQRAVLNSFLNAAFIENVQSALHVDRLDDGILCDSVLITSTLARWLECTATDTQGIDP